ncbi:4993_t:CDS:2 [Ambispora leptoticha]|uniref:4993_t:CDS:1 n=1 Tax=Ambispora leptoticha TaxID=144679 RepID=A0A9N9HQ83_9GLOM|nr:4993_t:CDS:2 [Ambispora leptoticha]
MSDPIDQLFDSHIVRNQSYDLLITMFLYKIFLNIHELYLVFLNSLSPDKVRPYPSDFFLYFSCGDYDLLSFLDFGRSRDTYTFLENRSSSLEDFIFFLYERSNKKAFSLVYKRFHIHYSTLNGTSFQWDKDFFNPDYKFSRTINQTIRVASVLNWDDGCNSEDNPFESFNPEYDSFDVYRSQGEREDRVNTQFYSDSSSDYGVDDVDCCYSDYDDHYFDN